MEILIRKVSIEGKRKTFQDTVLQSSEIAIGSSLDCDIQLFGDSILKQQAHISFKSNQAVFRSASREGVIVNGERKTKGQLTSGDRLNFSGHEVLVVSAPTGFDFAVEVCVDEQQQKAYFESNYQTSLKQTWLSNRYFSYGFLFCILALFLALPILSYFERLSDTSEAKERDLSSNETQFDVLWSSGPLLSAHSFQIGNDCSVCHVEAFKQVDAPACMSCHSNLGGHLATTIFTELSEQHKNIAELQAQDLDCQSCHKEHNEPESIVMTSDALCVGCHSQSWGSDQHAVLASTAFSKLAHPEFKLDYLNLAKDDVSWKIDEQPHTEKQVEQSNLKFSHQVHLDVEKVSDRISGNALACSSCHSLKSDMQHFEPVTMEKHCRSCHDLKYEVSDPILELPHGSPELIIKTLQGHYIKKAIAPDVQVASDTRRRRPGKESQETSCIKSPFQCGMDAAANEAEIQFKQRGCVTCHVVIDNQSEDISSRFSILPVQLNTDWYRESVFDHKSHLTQVGKQESFACLTCHEADKSTSSADVLIPPLDNCLTCHDSSKHRGQVPLDCVSCHQYHHKQNLYNKDVLEVLSEGET